MKYMISIFLIFFSQSSFAQERTIGIALERYSVLAGAWALDQRCKILDEAEQAAFRLDFAVINVSLTTTLNNPNLIYGIQNSGKKAADSDRYKKCDSEVPGIVRYASAAARQWSGEIRKTVLEAATRLEGAPR
jgi:hypothetical protein